MTISRDESVIERNTELFKELESMSLNEQIIYYSEDHRIHDYLRAIQEKYGSVQGHHGIQTNLDFPFKLTLCTGALIVVKIKEIKNES